MTEPTISAKGLVAGLRQLATLARQIEQDLWANAAQVAEAKERARLQPAIDAIGAELDARGLVATAAYAEDAGFTYISVGIGADMDRYLKVEDTYGDNPRVGIYPAGAEAEGRQVPIFDLDPVLERIDQLDLKRLAETVADLCEFALDVNGE